MICWLFPREDGDFASLGQLLNDLRFKVSIVDAGLPELSGVAVLLPVMVPVSSAVRPKSKHIDLEESKFEVTNVSVEILSHTGCGTGSIQLTLDSSGWLNVYLSTMNRAGYCLKNDDTSINPSTRYQLSTSFDTHSTCCALFYPV